MFASTENPTWDYNEAAWWSTIELHVGIICACLPSLRSLFVNLGVKILGSSSDKSRATGYATNGSKVGTNRSRAGSEKLQSQNTPKHGDEGDFIPLVDVPDSKAVKKQSDFGVVVSDADSYDSDGKNNGGYHARAYK